MTNGFIPAPNLQAIDRGPTAAQIAAVAGADIAAPFIAREQARRAAEDAIQDLTDHRPGGHAWKAAADADTAALIAGKKATAISRVLDGEHQRYGQALAAVTAHRQIADVRRNLDRTGLEAAIEIETLEATTEWASAAQRGWSARADKAEAWAERRKGETALARWRAAGEVAAWLEGRRTQVVDAVDYRAEDRLPEDRHACGAWLALQLVTEPETKWWRVPHPDKVEWPLHAFELVDKAVRVDAVHAVHGGAEVTTQPAGHTTRSGADQLARDLGISA